MQQYADLAKRISEQNDILADIKNEEPQIEFLLAPFVYVPRITTIGDDGSPDRKSVV